MKKVATKSLTPEAESRVVLAAIELRARPTLRKVSSLKISSAEDFQTAAELLKSCKDLARLAKEKELSLTRPLNQVVDGIRDLFRPFLKDVEAIEADTKQKMLAWTQQAARLQAKLEADFDSGKIKKVDTLLKKQAALESTGNVRRTWKAVAIDPSLTPARFMRPDEEAIYAALRAGEAVAGWEWRQVESITI